MDAERLRIQDDLRGLVAGDVRCDDVSLRLYASDASIYQMQPLAVVRPRSTADVSIAVRYAGEKRLSIHPRGAGAVPVDSQEVQGTTGRNAGPVRAEVSHRARLTVTSTRYCEAQS